MINLLIKKYRVKKDYILGHSDIAPLRKIDPGEKFPWKVMSEHNCGIWYKKGRKGINYSNKNIMGLNKNFTNLSIFTIL